MCHSSVTRRQPRVLLFVLLFYGPGDGTAVTITTKASFFKDCLLISIRRKGSNLQLLKLSYASLLEVVGVVPPLRELGGVSNL